MEPRPTADCFVGLVPGFPGAGGAHGAAVRRCLAGGAGRPAPIAHGAVVVILGLPLPILGADTPAGTPSRAAVAAAAALRSASLTASASASKRGRSATVSLASSSPASPIARPFCVASERCLMSSQQRPRHRDTRVSGRVRPVDPPFHLSAVVTSTGGGGAEGTTRGAGEPRTFLAVEHIAREIVRAFVTVSGPRRSVGGGGGRCPPTES